MGMLSSEAQDMLDMGVKYSAEYDLDGIHVLFSPGMVHHVRKGTVWGSSLCHMLCAIWYSIATSFRDS